MQHLSEDLDSELTRDLHAMSARRERGQKAIEGANKCPLCSEQRKMGVLTAAARQHRRHSAAAQLHFDFFRQLNHDFKQYRRPIVKAGRAQTREGLSKQAFRHSCFQGVRLFM